MSEFRSKAVLSLLLHRENPRHTPKENQEEIIAHLLADEEVYNLARHMGLHGINPLEVIAVFSDEDGNLVVAEGNRRVCAAQLLTDPNKAPISARARFKMLAKDSKDVSKVMVREFPDYATAQPWLQVLHDGEQDGVGRREWSPTQKARATTRKSTDALAVALTDYALERGWITAAQRDEIQISTITRYLANPEVRAALGLASAATSSDIELHADAVRFESAAKQFIEDGLTDKLSSRSKGHDWRAYANGLNATFGGVIPQLKPWKASAPSAKPTARPSVRQGTRVRVATPDTSQIVPSKRLVEALNALGRFKLSSLYRSLTNLRLDDHPALATTGAWVFLETLTALHGRTHGNSFVAYLNNKGAGWFGKETWKAKRISLNYIEEHGNAEKHDPQFATVDARNLHNHFQVLDDLLVKLVTECPR